METSEIEKKFELAAKLIKKSRCIVALTGAGSSTESGIRDFRGPNGLWKEEDPMKWAHIDTFMRDPGAYWARAADSNRGLNFNKIEPNEGHKGLAELERLGKLTVVITQNVDGLHQKAGNTDVIELHGTALKAHCLKCGAQYKRADVIERVRNGENPPLCTQPRCKGILKSNTILFGESLPQYALLRAYQLSETCDLMIVLGSSMVVYPAAQLPNVARKCGANIIIINLEETEKDYLADIVINGKIGDILPKIIKKYIELKQLQPTEEIRPQSNLLG
ncbi:MAG: NAD-dependent deacetylase [Promethearchaeota archaeon]